MFVSDEQRTQRDRDWWMEKPDMVKNFKSSHGPTCAEVYFDKYEIIW